MPCGSKIDEDDDNNKCMNNNNNEKNCITAMNKIDDDDGNDDDDDNSKVMDHIITWSKNNTITLKLPNTAPSIDGKLRPRDGLWSKAAGKQISIHIGRDGTDYGAESTLRFVGGYSRDYNHGGSHKHVCRGQRGMGEAVRAN